MRGASQRACQVELLLALCGSKHSFLIILALELPCREGADALDGEELQQRSTYVQQTLEASVRVAVQAEHYLAVPARGQRLGELMM